MKNFSIIFSLFVIFSLDKGFAQNVSDQISEIHSSVQIDGKTIPYIANTGNLTLKDEQGNPKATVFFIAYFKSDVQDISERPLTFCFNGGPGCSSIWLHIGAFGPKRVQAAESIEVAPYQFGENHSSLLDLSDLVFIDPVSTGYSRAAQGQDPKQFHGVEEDIKSVSDFIRLFTTRYDRWNSPKFLAGESYGTARAAGLAAHLLDAHGIQMNGVVLLSSIINFQTVYDSKRSRNDLPYILAVPSMTAAAWYHQKLPQDLQAGTLQNALRESERFASTDYALALMQGNQLSSADKDKISAKLSRLTGLSDSYVKRADLRINPYRFVKELLRDKNLQLGRFDLSVAGLAIDPCSEWYEYDPSLEAVLGAFNATFNRYVRDELNWKVDDKYQLTADVQPWNYGQTRAALDLSSDLQETMIKNPNLKVFVGSGYYDFATPYYASIYTFNHLGLPPLLAQNIQMNFYEAGHMMYIYPVYLEQLKKDLTHFYRAALSHSAH